LEMGLNGTDAFSPYSVPVRISVHPRSSVAINSPLTTPPFFNHLPLPLTLFRTPPMLYQGMSTPNRTEINRANSQHSTGPKTQAGKQRSSLNALRHGLTGQLVDCNSQL
jgi:hypothetical protein